MTSKSPLALACSLSPGAYADRLREFRRLFAAALRESRREPACLHLVLDASITQEEVVHDLLRREQECCPFFTFVVEATEGALRVQAAVPEGAGECLDDLERMAARALARRA